tara:strand:+ start:123 stop:665 length:543 start_codon:yes stop_codon:yes gene_type:complete
MINLLPSIVLLTTTFSPNVTYQIVTDEFEQHNTYIYGGALVTENADQAVYSLDIKACEFKERLIYHNVIDEVIFLNDRRPRKSQFFLQKDFNRCFLVVKKHMYRNNMYYNRDYDYWYPDYNIIHVAPNKGYRIRITPSRKSKFQKKRIPIVKYTYPKIRKSKTTTKKVNYKKYHKKHSKR